MKKFVVYVLAALALMAAPAVGMAYSDWDLTGTYTVEFTCVTNCSGMYPHSMTVSSMDVMSGLFSGTGYYIPDPSYAWDLNGTSTDSDVTAHILYTGSNAGYYVDMIGTVAGDGTMSGTAVSGSGQTFTWETTSGAATPAEFTVVNGGGNIYDTRGKKIWTFGSEVRVDSDGVLSGGHFTLQNHQSKLTCHFMDISNLVIATTTTSDVADFDATGECSDNTTKTVHITIEDMGEPGAKVDRITITGDLSFGPRVIDGGNFQVNGDLYADLSAPDSEDFTLYADGSIACPGADDLSDPDGYVTITPTTGGIDYTINLMGAEPLRTYTVAISQEPTCASPSFPGSFATDASGNGTFSGFYALSSGVHNVLVNMSTSAVSLSDPKHREIATTDALVIVP
ncbi:MAG TPA: hypothetical protein VJB98_01535 [Candidatus Paceibacterota bacterium]